MSTKHTASALPRRGRRAFRKTLTPYLLLAPVLIFIFCFMLWPIVNVFSMSFEAYQATRPNARAWIGLANYVKIFTDDAVFARSLVSTLKWVLISVAFQTVLGFWLAYVLNKKFRGRGMVRALTLAPWAVAGVMVGIIWKLILGETYGLLNDVLKRLNLITVNISWFSTVNLAMFSCILANIWRGIPFFTISYVSALSSIPDDLYESAKATFTAQDSILPLNDYTDQIPNMAKIDEGLTTNLISLGNGALYGIPFAYNQEVAWYNTALFSENGIEAPPATQAEFLALCEQFANREGGTYFYSLRGVRPYDSLLAWLFTYTDGCGYNGSWFDENGKCILSDARFVEALDAYANIYKNNWVSGDSVNNNYAEVVAEFGSGVSMYIIHNSSSESNHRTNLGEGNFAPARVLANDEGRYYASGLQPNVFCITKNQNADHDYTGALALINELLSTEVNGGLCREVGRVPCNVEVAEQDWYAESPNMMLAAGYLTDPNYMQILNPYWLSDFSNMITTDMTADFQALLMGDMSAEECLTKWAETIDEYQADYLASLS